MLSKSERTALNWYLAEHPNGPQPSEAMTTEARGVVTLRNANGVLAKYRIRGTVAEKLPLTTV